MIQAPITVMLGLGEMHASAEQNVTLACQGLGSCVALSVYDPIARAGGMAHMVLPVSSEGHGHTHQEAKFVDQAVPRLLEEVEMLGGRRSRLIAKLVGGAQMVRPIYPDSSLNVGQRNAEAAKEVLKRLGIRIGGSDLGGNRGRTARLSVDTGRLRVSTAGGAIYEL